MPSTSTGASLTLADRATATTVLLGRTPIDRQLFAYDSVAAAASSSSLVSSTALPIIPTTTSSPLSNFLLPTSGGEPLYRPQEVSVEPLAGGELLDHHSTAPVTTLYSFEELGRWTSDTNCTALIHALLASFSVILVSELGDKTFIITAIMAMKNSRSLVFLSSAMALLSMTILSVGMGVAVTVIPKLYTHYASIVLFLCFGLKMLKESYDMKDNKDGDETEFDEVKRSLEQDSNNNTTNTNSAKCGGKCDLMLSAPVTPAFATATHSDNLTTKELTSALVHQHTAAVATKEAAAGLVPPLADASSEAKELGAPSDRWYSRAIETLYIAPIVIKVFTMVFIAEWGDRSQMCTVILAAREDTVGVFIGSLTGHIFCTGLAVIGGRFVADMISVRTIFAILTGPEQSGA